MTYETKVNRTAIEPDLLELLRAASEGQASTTVMLNTLKAMLRQIYKDNKQDDLFDILFAQVEPKSLLTELANKLPKNGQ
jgi:hypothetical protein